VDEQGGAAGVEEEGAPSDWKGTSAGSVEADGAPPEWKTRGPPEWMSRGPPPEWMSRGAPPEWMSRGAPSDWKGGPLGEAPMAPDPRAEDAIEQHRTLTC
jgi:hypothetical protein